ncbi:MAG: hypothetical protein KF749_11820 [Bacteroidetes bacterium]|nr:hypothetical protein [Bacteroidota bacterium]MCW5894192.1 hypothetical protein [Bacteroidota bacterium]
MRKVFAGVCAALFCATSVFAGNGGSAYTMFGIGDVRYNPGVRSTGMGYTSFGLPSGNTINTLSPASWARISRVRIEAGGVYEGINTAESNKSLYQAKGLFSGAMLAFPISPANGIVLVGGFSPFSYVGYNTSFRNSQANIDYRINEIGSGSLTKAIVGLSYAPHQDISLGLGVNYFFGQTAVERTFIPLTSGTSGGTLNSDEEKRGLSFTIGGMYNGLGVLGEALRPLSLGFAVTTESNLKLDISNRIIFTSESDTFATAEKRLSIPVAIGVGIAYQFSDRWIVAADYFTQAWKNARYDGQPLLNIRNNNRFGIGAEKLPIKDASGWFDKLTYRLGFSYNQTYFQIYGEPINEWAFTGGFTMPVAGETRMNVGIEYAQRGSKSTVVQPNLISTNLVKDNIIRVSFSLTIVEPWFVRYEEE